MQARVGSGSPRAARGSCWPAATSAQWPMAAFVAQNRHKPSHASSQQTPSVQWPDAHCSSRMHVRPSNRSPLPHTPSTHSAPVEQSASDAHVVRQVASAQAYGAQCTTADTTHVPLPSHVLSGASVAPTHAAAPQAVPLSYLAHAPAPLHSPLVPQEVGPESTHRAWGSRAPPGDATQNPSRPGRLHCMHPLSHAVEQQTPSTQKPDPHSDPAAHFMPKALGPQPPSRLLVTQTSAQVPVAPSQGYGAHSVRCPPSRHVPLRQERAPTTESPSQRPAPHGVPSGCLRQWPAPSHVPSVPQVEGASAEHPGRLGRPPAPTSVHVPCRPADTQVRHAPSQSASQHTPSMQKPLAQSLAQVHAAPNAARPASAPAHAPSCAGAASAAASRSSRPCWTYRVEQAPRGHDRVTHTKTTGAARRIIQATVLAVAVCVDASSAVDLAPSSASPGAWPKCMLGPRWPDRSRTRSYGQAIAHDCNPSAASRFDGPLGGPYGGSSVARPANRAGVVHRRAPITDF
jgi:hypothetical protein